MDKESTCNAGDTVRCEINFRVGKIPWGGHGNPLQYCCLENCMNRGTWRPRVHRISKSWARLKGLSMHTHICYTFKYKSPGEGNGTPLQYSCLENPMEGGAWWAAIHGVAKSWTLLNGFTFTFHFHALEKEMATIPVVLPGESQGRGSLVGCRLWGCIESDMTKVT